MKVKRKSQGLGDTIAKITKTLKIDKVTEAIAHLAGAEGCGCDDRKEFLNQLFPYNDFTRKFKAMKDFEYIGENYQKGKTYKVTKNDLLYENIIQYVRDGYLEEII